MNTRVGVLTSGGDAQGMNPAVRAVVRRAIQRGAQVSAIREGYAGLVAGDIEAIDWLDVSYILHLGGTEIGTARCAAFRTLEGRRSAAANLLRAGIDRLVTIGGDGSLTGADTLRSEWSDHVAALLAAGEISADQVRPHLYIAGLTGSIDNDIDTMNVNMSFPTSYRQIPCVSPHVPRPAHGANFINMSTCASGV